MRARSTAEWTAAGWVSDETTTRRHPGPSLDEMASVGTGDYRAAVGSARHLTDTRFAATTGRRVHLSHTDIPRRNPLSHRRVHRAIHRRVPAQHRLGTRRSLGTELPR